MPPKLRFKLGSVFLAARGHEVFLPRPDFLVANRVRAVKQVRLSRHAHKRNGSPTPCSTDGGQVIEAVYSHIVQQLLKLPAKGRR